MTQPVATTEANIPRVMFISLLSRMLDRVEREERWLAQELAERPTVHRQLASVAIDIAVARAHASGVLAGLLHFVNANGTTLETSAVIARADALKIERNL